MNVAVVGSGGREHVIAWKLSQSAMAEELFAIPGNGGTAPNVPIDPMDFPALKEFCLKQDVALLVVGPEQPLVAGVVDYFRDTEIKVLGPDRAAARLEGSKIWAKRFMLKYGVATAESWVLENGDAEPAIQALNGNLVVKYDGLAGGKGVVVCSSKEEARAAVADLRQKHGADAPLLLEERLLGQELSVIGFTDGEHIILLLPSQDHKQAYDGDRGPNTGGMGAYCPVPFCDERVLSSIREAVVDPTLRGIRQEGLDYRGALYFGLMLTEEGPKALEYNVRLGDPEAEVILPALKSDILVLMLSCMDRTLSDFQPEFFDGFFVDVVLTSRGYPGAYEKGFEISGLDVLPDTAMAFHAGTRRKGSALLTAGGRVLNIVARGPDLKSAIGRAYEACAGIYFHGVTCRHDIGGRVAPR